MRHFLITGCAGFIGYHLAELILNKDKKTKIVGLDNINTYYDIKIKKSRLAELKNYKNFIFKKGDISNYEFLINIFKKYKFEKVFNLAAQAGVRMSIINKKPYYDSNILGFYNIINICSKFNVKHLLYASSSSVYGDSKKFPLKESMETNKNISFYASTKKINELIAYNYSYVHNIKTTGLRIFTAYGPYGRPDMAIFKIIDSIVNDKVMTIYDKGKGYRDFTYVGDTVKAIYELSKINKKNNKFEIYNIASGKCVNLNKIILILENLIGKKLQRKYENKNIGDVNKTHGSNKKLKKIIKIDFTKLHLGLNNYLKWYLKYYKIKI